MIDIEIDSKSGFCFGVINAIAKAEEWLANEGALYCLGDIVHNGCEVDRLRRLGLQTIDHRQFATLTNTRVLLRAHGEPPSTYQTSKHNNIKLIDASCPVVLKLQKRIKKTYENIQNSAAQIVIYGKKGHAEVNGLVGQTDNTAIVIENEHDLQQIDFQKDIYLFSQTTKSLEGFNNLVNIMQEKTVAPAQFHFFDTICRQVANRIPNIKKFAAEKDIVLFVSDPKSSNGKQLFECCKSVNRNSFFISNPSEISDLQIDLTKKIGICGATSTPRQLMEKVADAIKHKI
ncbi:MAG: 4-hydroxy-3-methylbut-2-enyl diphosphate reductase [Prevotellaceae bacterium]|nr:4-hydroxy-3-methylbut-2-enyl diphosphate reductase [Prevotellaceae bacterium]